LGPLWWFPSVCDFKKVIICQTADCLPCVDRVSKETRGGGYTCASRCTAVLNSLSVTPSASWRVPRSQRGADSRPAKSPRPVVVSSSFTLTARLAIAQDLGEMVLEVTDVVGHEVIESGGPFSRYLLPGELVEIVLGPRTKPLLARR
jgi:hypothetical protein